MCSLFIHIMPPVTLHCLIHLIPEDVQKVRFPAVWSIKYSPVTSKDHYGLGSMVLWATMPYIVWQLSYHFFITVRRASKIAAGRPTSFTWLRKSYSKAWIGKIVLGLPDILQEPAFMLIQYSYAVATMLPCPLWFWYRWASAAFLMSVFVWSIWNGATYYIDVFGKRFQNELELLKRDVEKWQQSPDGYFSPVLGAKTPAGEVTNPMSLPAAAVASGVDGGLTPGSAIPTGQGRSSHKRTSSLDAIPLLDSATDGLNLTDVGAAEIAKDRKKEE
jgi:hypothetical protein